MQTNIWRLAEAIYDGRMKEAWGKDFPDRFPRTEKERRVYPHNPVVEVDLALASAREVLKKKAPGDEPGA